MVFPARVGVLVQAPSQQKHRNNGNNTSGGNGPNRQKGITMEDLKKQTALRLAQEQQQRQGRTIPTGFQQQQQQQQKRPGHGSSDPNFQSYNQPRAGHAYQDSRTEQYHGGTQNTTPAPAPQSSHNHYAMPPQQSSNVPQLVTGYDTATTNNMAVPNVNSAAQGNQYYDVSPGNKRGKAKNLRRAHVPQSHLSSSNNMAQRSPTRGINPDQFNYARSVSAPIGFPASQNMAIEQQPSSTTSSSSKSKLPHGLTVHELKEMTKARLQAEAAERHNHDNIKQCDNDNMQRTSPIDIESSRFAGRERALSRDSGLAHLRHHHGMPSDSMGSIPSMVRVNPPAGLRESQHHGDRPPQMSPLPPGFQNFNSNIAASSSSSTFVDVSEFTNNIGVDRNRSLSQNRHPASKTEAWENASVTSHNSTVASEYLGSESAYSSCVAGSAVHTDDPVGSTFNRARSYSANNNNAQNEFSSYDMRNTAVSPSPGGTFFDAAVGGGPNRRRACTLSPQPVLIHEDRPGFGGGIGEDLGLPHFFSGSRSSLVSRAGNSFAPVLPQIGPETTNFGHNSGFIGTSSAEIFNRPRTSSTTSLPPISHTAEEFAVDRSAPGPRLPPTLHVFNSVHLGEGIPTGPVVENTFGSQYVSQGRDGPAPGNPPSSVFRDPPNLSRQVIPPSAFNSDELVMASGNRPPGIGVADSHLFTSEGSSIDKGFDSKQNTTWRDVPADLFGSGPASRSADFEESLASDLGSILQLSGATEQNERVRSGTHSLGSGLPSGTTQNFYN